MDRARLDGVVVTAPEATFTLRLDGVPLALEPNMKDASSRIEVMAPLRFTASHGRGGLKYRTKAGQDLYGGRIRVGKGSAPEWIGINSDFMQLSLQSTLGVDVRSHLEVPCANLELRDGSLYSTPAQRLPPPNRMLGTGKGFVSFHLEPSQSDPLEVRYAGPYAVLDKQPGWVLLEATWADGSRVRGWVLERNTTSQVQEPLGWGERYTGGPECGRSDPPELSSIALRGGAPISAVPQGVPWAVVSRDVRVEAFPSRRADGWLQVATIPGLLAAPCSEHEFVWVQTRDVK